MANPAVEKLKALGILHGEKAVVGLTAALFVACAGLAVSRGTLEMKPEELASSANAASSNLDRQQPVPDVLAKLERDGLVDPKLVQVVDNQLKNALKPEAYKTRLEWVTPEPGAGLIRDQPELIAPTELAAFPGRGGILLYPLDESGERIPIDDAAPKKKGGRNKKREEKPEDKKRRELEEERKKGLFVGKTDEEKEKANEEAAAAPARSKEITRGERWVVITGVVDNEKLKRNYLLALKNPAIAYPNYKRVDVERRQLGSEGGWTEWAKVDRNKSYDILDNLPQLETELVPEPKRPEAIVDHLPFLKAGYWAGVHVAKLVPADVLEASTKPTPPPARGGFGRGGMGSGSSMDSSAPSNSGAMGGGSVMGGRGSVMANSGAGGNGGGSSGSSSEEANFTKVEEKSVMLRVLDFTVEPDNTYQFRVRIVVVNPNKDRTDTNPGVDIDSTELLGPWSEATEPVTLPADVAAYAMAPEPTTRRDDLVNFEVIKFDPESGHTLWKYDGAGPGELIGEFGSTQMPDSEGKGPLPKNIDFNSRSIVLDTMGGSQRIPDIGLDRNQFVVPVVAAIIEPNGSVVIRDQAVDRADEVREDMEANYKQAIADSNQARKAGSGSRSPGGGDPRMRGSSKKKGRR